MPGPTSIVATARKIPWAKVMVAAQLVYTRGSAAAKALDAKERKTLLDLVKKSQGRPANLTERERARVRELAGKALTAARKG
jgi:hypothetical protein